MIKNISSITARKISGNFLILILGWFACLVLPHFQRSFVLSISIAQIFIAIIMFRSMFNLLQNLSHTERFFTPRIFLVFPGFYSIAVTLNFLGFKELYILLNRFGSGTMFVENKVFLFGDLAHVTSASDCPIPIKIGELICDPFSRSFNQNPHIVELFRLIGFSNTLILGLTFSFLFFTLVIFMVSKNQINPMTFFIILLSPPIVLAIDRGNEVITILLITTGIYMLARKNHQQILGAVLLAISCLFKLWPVILLSCLLVFLYKKISFFTKGIMLLPIIYWLIYFENATKMISFTDKGSPLGLSFGIKHYLNFSIPVAHIALFLATTVVIVLYFTSSVKNLTTVVKEFSYDLPIFLSLSLTYIAIWFVGTSYVYRLAIFIPLLIYLNRSFLPNKSRLRLESLLIITLLTSRLSITTVFTNSIAVILSIIVARRVLDRFKLSS